MNSRWQSRAQLRRCGTRDGFHLPRRAAQGGIQTGGRPLCKLSRNRGHLGPLFGGARGTRAQLAGGCRYPNHPESESRTQARRNTDLCFSCGTVHLRNDWRNAERNASHVSLKLDGRKISETTIEVLTSYAKNRCSICRSVSPSALLPATPQSWGMHVRRAA